MTQLTEIQIPLEVTEACQNYYNTKGKLSGLNPKYLRSVVSDLSLVDAQIYIALFKESFRPVSKEQKALNLIDGALSNYQDEHFDLDEFLNQVKTALTNVDLTEFGGIPANPEYDTLMKALKIIKKVVDIRINHL